MAGIVFHEAGVAARRIAENLREVLAGSPQVAHLLDQIDAEIHTTPSLVLTGQYSSGKSTLIRALTNESADVVIDSDVSTSTVEYFMWEDVVYLVDTPGVQAGDDTHDEKAEAALRQADLVLFTVTVELFDDRLIDHLQHVLTDLDKAEQTVLVVTKAGMLTAAPGVRETAIREALGTHADTVPWIECDAEYYRKSLRSTDSTRAGEYLRRSNFAALIEQINALVRQRGQLGQIRQPFQGVIAVVDQAIGLLVDDPDEASALIVLGRQRMALSQRRERLDAELDRYSSEFRTNARAHAEHFVDQLEDGQESGGMADNRMDQAIADLNASLQNVLDQFKRDVDRAVTRQFDGLTSDLREIEASPHAQHIMAVTTPAVEMPELGHIRPSTPSQHRRGLDGEATKQWLTFTGKHLKDFRAYWVAGEGLKASSGTAGHRVVTEVGHFMGKKFKPWEAVKLANGVGKVARVGGTAISVALTLSDVWTSEVKEMAQARQKLQRRRNIVDGVVSQSEQIAVSALNDAKAAIDRQLDEQVAQIDDVMGHINASRQQRSRTEQELGRIRDEATHELAALGD